jgi:hypothetical protein
MMIGKEAGRETTNIAAATVAVQMTLPGIKAGITAILLVGTETVEIKKIVDIDDLLLLTVATVSIITASK